MFVKLDTKKYGEIFKAKNDEKIPDDQWVVFVAKDDAFADVLPYYLARCVKRGADKEHIEAVLGLIGRVSEWRRSHPELCKTPDAAGEYMLDSETSD